MKIRMVKCPHCAQPAEYSANNPARPFCSDRCKLIDLGDWAEGSHKIPAEESPELTSTTDAEEYD